MAAWHPSRCQAHADCFSWGGKGQWSTPHSFGLGHYQILRNVIGLQALHLAVPGLGNTQISLVKDTSLASAITVVELLWSLQASVQQHINRYRYIALPLQSIG